MKEDVSLERRRDILNIYPRLRLLQTELVKKKKEEKKKKVDTRLEKKDLNL